MVDQYRRFILLSSGLLLTASLIGQPLSFAGSRPKDDRRPQFRQAEKGYAYRFPFDHGSHDEFRTEWWYYTGHLETDGGRQFGYQLTFFRRRMPPDAVKDNPSRWAIEHLYFAHCALSDHDGRTFRYAEKISRAGIGKAGADTGRLRVWIDRWKAETPDHGAVRQRLEASTHTFEVKLDVVPQKPPVVHGLQGVSRKGPAQRNASHYYSLTRLATTGSVLIDGEQLHVTGISWMDHEFGSGELGEDQTGWDWFSLQLDNGLDVMLYLMRRRDGSIDSVSSGTLIHRDGRMEHLSMSDIDAETLDRWQSHASGASYPSRWRIIIPKTGLDVLITPRQPNQELITKQSTRVTYWEGAVTIAGLLRGAAVGGAGYVELTGYAEAFAPP